MTQLLQDFLQISLPVSIIIAILALLHPFLRKRYAAKWRYWAWLLLAVRLLIPFHFDLPESAPIAPVQLQMPNRIVYTYTPQAAKIAPQKAAAVFDDAVPEPTAQTPDAAITTPTQPQTIDTKPDAPLSAPPAAPRQISLVSLAGFGWLLGFVVLLLWNVFAYTLARRKLLRSALPATGVASQLAFLCKYLGIARKIPAYETPLVQSPLLLGVLKPCILLPDTAFTAQDSTMILCHELVHYKRHDIGYKMLLQLVCCVHWFNPLVWLMASLASRDIEISCDDAVLHGQNDVFRESYAGSIMQVLRRGNGNALPCSTAFSDSKTTLKQRFINIFDANQKHSGIVLLSLLLAASILATSLVACTVKDIAAPVSGDAASALSASLPPLAADETAITQADIPAQAMELIDLYEARGNGHATPADGWHFIQCDYFIFSYLETYGDVAQYQSDSDAKFGGSWHIPTDLLQAGMHLLFDGTPVQPTGDFLVGSYGAAGYAPPVITLTLKQGVKSADGTLKLSFARASANRPLADVDYTLKPFTVDTVPPELSKKFATGDVIYRLGTVVNLPLASLNADVKTVEIGTVEELLFFAKDYNENAWRYGGNTYLLTADLDLTGVDFTPIGTNNRMLYWDDARDASGIGFGATFDGQGHTITGLTLSKQPVNENEMHRSGFFSQIDSTGVVQNLTLKNATITDGERSGILAGSNHGSIKNCHVQGTVSGTALVGGLAGETTSDSHLPSAESDIKSYRNNFIENCTADVDVTGTNEVGGLCGNASLSVIKDCSVTGTVTGFKANQESNVFQMPCMTGGFVGDGNNSDFINCNVDVPLIIKANGAWIGAFAGSVYNGSCQNCTYNPAVSGNWERIDVMNDVNATDYTNYDIKAKA